MASVNILKALVAVFLLEKHVSADYTKLSNHTVILVVAFDGVRADYFDKVLTPALDSLKASGVRVPYMEPVFPASTFPNMQSIATGVFAETHGIVDNVVFDPEFNQSLSGFNDDPGFWNYHSDVIPIWIRNEMAGEGRTSGCLMWPGSNVPFGPNNDKLPTYYYPGTPTYDESPPWEDRVETVISWMTNATNPANLVFLYYEQPDLQGHAFGPNAPETMEEIRKTDNRTSYLIERLKDADIFDRINLIMTSDHGMKEVTEKNIINITQVTAANPYLIESGLLMSPIMQLDATKGKLEKLYEVFKNHSNNHNYTVWRKGEMRQPHFYTASRRIKELVLVADPGSVFDDFYVDAAYQNRRWNFVANESREYGVHGYSNAHAAMRPFFLAHGPSFRRDVDHAPIKNVDIVPLISTILGIPEPPNNGSLDRVITMINPIYTPRSSGNMTYCLSCFSYVAIIIFTVGYVIH